MKYLNHWLRVPMDKIIKDTPNDMQLGEKIRQIYNNKNNKNNNNNKNNSMSMMSLYDYLGHAAGSELGQKVAQAAAKSQVKHEMREIANPAFKGKVMLYPRAFLDLYFRNGLNESTSGKQLLKG